MTGNHKRPDPRDEPTAGVDRRGALVALLVAPAAVAAPREPDAGRDADANARPQSGYRETAHVLRYYEVSRY